MIDLIIKSLASRRLEVEPVDGTLNVSQGTGIMARRANLDPSTFLEWLNEKPTETHERYIAGYTNGVKTVMLEPKRSKASEWTFVESAGSLLPSIEVESFVRGVDDATGGDPAWVQPFHDDLVVAWTMRLNHGIRAVTAHQVERWGVTEDRVVSAGRSLLFHHTQNVEWQPTQFDGVQKVRAGDGHDAARLLIAEDVWFTDVDRSWRFAIPTPDLLMAVRRPEATDNLLRAARQEMDGSDYPLTDTIWKLTAKGPGPLEGE